MTVPSPTCIHPNPCSTQRFQGARAYPLEAVLPAGGSRAIKTVSQICRLSAESRHTLAVQNSIECPAPARPSDIPQNGGRHVPNFVHRGPSSGSHNPCIARRRTYEALLHTTVLRHNDSLNSCCSWWHHACPARIDTPRTCSSSRKPAHPHEPSRVQYPKAMYSMPPHRGHAAVPHHEAAGGAGTDGLCAITSLP